MQRCSSHHAAMNSAKQKARFPRCRGFTLLEAVMCTVILALAVTGILQGLNMGLRLARRASCATTTNHRATKKLEEVMSQPYGSVPVGVVVEYSAITQATGIVLDWAITTTVTEITSPVRYKNVTIDATWRKDGLQRHVQYWLMKSP